MGGAHRRQGAPAPGGHGESRAADRPGRGLYLRDRGAGRRRRSAHAGVRRAGLSGRDQAQIPFPRSQARASARQHHAARQDHRFDPHAHEGGRLLRIPDADPDRFFAGRRARLSGALAHPPGQVLRAAAGAAAVQAAHHGGGLRPLFPDRALLPRRGRARRPLARRVLSARSGDELRHAGRCVRRGRAGDPRRVRGICGRQDGDAEVSAHSLCGSDGEIRHRQARPAQSDRNGRRERGLPRLRLQDFRQDSRDAGQCRLGHSGAEGRQPRLLRPHELMGARRGPAGPGLYLLARGRGERGGSARQEHRPRAHQADRRSTRHRRRRRLLLRRRQSQAVRQVRRPRPHQGRRGARPDRARLLRAVLDRRFSHV